jgi:hypothetical protein
MEKPFCLQVENSLQTYESPFSDLNKQRAMNDDGAKNQSTGE